MTFPESITPRLLEGRLAFITGAGQGNGRALALGLSQAGARIIATDVNAEAVLETMDLVRRAGGQAWAYHLDVTSADACNQLAAQVAEEIGHVDLLVNNAGIVIRATADSPRAAENWAKVINVNVNGTFNVTMAFRSAIKETRGAIVNIASIASYVGQDHSLGYAPSKGAIKLFTQSMAQDLAPYGARVNALAPGIIETPMTEVTRQNPERLQGFLKRIPLGRVGQTADLVGPVIFLASDMARYITGVTIPVDGGFLAV